MNRPCGCDSAEQCWRSCCCFTNQQKVVWAKKHSVSLPSYVVDAAKKESLASDPAKKTSCPHCVELSEALVGKSPSDDGQGSASGDVVPMKSKYLYGISVQKCRGLQSLWQILSMSMMPRCVFVTDAGGAGVVYLQWAVALLWEFEREAPEPPPRLAEHRRAFAQLIG